jgi:sec-independent protein translocase protein TatA
MGFIGGHLPELIIVLVVILIIWGPGKLPDIGAGIGKGIREFRKASSETHDAVMKASTTAAPTQPAPAVPVVAAPEPVAVPADPTPHQPSVSG